MDLHAPQIQGFFDIPVDHLYAKSVLIGYLRQRHPDTSNLTVVSPDVGGVKMARAYADADLVICRAGALTVSELAAVGVGAVLVPYPAAVDDHQTFNAQFLVREGAAVLIADRDLTPEKLAGTLRELCAGRGKLLAMAERARLVARPQAAQELADICLAQLRAA
jgi:UDP-N-acetylglucosamine:LPS N-acetylglucosamine transferase